MHAFNLAKLLSCIETFIPAVEMLQLSALHSVRAVSSFVGALGKILFGGFEFVKL